MSVNFVDVDLIFFIFHFILSQQLLTLHDKIALLHKEHGQLSEKRNSRNITNEFVYRVKLRELQNSCKVSSTY